MGSDTMHTPLLPVAWRVALVLGLAALTAQLMATTQYYATIFLLALLMAGLMFGVARLLLQGRSAADNIAANHAIARLQESQRKSMQTQDHLQALLDTVSAALLVLEEDGRIDSANRAARLLVRSDGPRLSDVAGVGAAAAGEIAALTPGTRAVVRLANGQQMLASAGHFSGAGKPRRLVSLQAVVGDLDAVQLKAWEDMSRVLAHEIMNSLTPIASLSESLSAMIRSEGASREAVEAVDTIARRSQGLVAFVGRYRQMAELPQPVLQTIALKDFVSEIDTLMRARLDGLGYVSRVEPNDLSLTADPGQLSQAVINLLHNAADAVSEIANPAITLACARENDRIVISVCDNGKGVPAQFAEDIFVPFFTTKSQGSGVGLSIVRQIALKHGGQVSVSQNGAGGATFTLTLPDR
jgi:two-component system nitrogen regulation sensor histidine kinase NtrY